MRQFRLISVLILTLSVFLAYTGFAQQTVTREDLKKQAAETMEKAKAYAEQQRQEYSKQIQGTIDDLSKKIDELKGQAKNYTGEAQKKIEAGLADLKVKQEQATKKLQEVGSSSGSAWEKLKAGLDKAVSDLQKAYNDASSHFK